MLQRCYQVSYFLVALLLYLLKPGRCLREDLRISNDCSDGYFYIYGVDDAEFQSQCYPKIFPKLIADYLDSNEIDKFHQAPPGSLVFHPWYEMQFMSSIYFTEYLQYHPCRTKDPEKSNMFISIYWSMIWKFVSPCFGTLNNIRADSSAQKALPHRHVIMDFFGANKGWTNGPAVYGAMDCTTRSPMVDWVTWDGKPANATCYARSPTSCPFANSCDGRSPECARSDGCYRVYTGWRRGLVMPYFDWFHGYEDDVKALSEREYLVAGAWTPKKNAMDLRPVLHKAMVALNDTVVSSTPNIGGTGSTSENGASVERNHSDLLMALPRLSYFVPTHNVYVRLEVPVYNNSVFCIVPKGDSPSRCGLSTCILAGSIPIVCSDHFVPPFDSMLPWHQFSYRIPEAACAHFISNLHLLPTREVQAKHKNLLSIRSFFKFEMKQLPNGEDYTRAGGPVDLMVRYAYDKMKDSVLL
mmetsp:Transcript_31089/g.51971  ORF Transcript_31089/g.51971 Transcript_31089/m.51971 type:complete len:469 (-) Transcript_31089:129-1535(-)